MIKKEVFDVVIVGHFAKDKLVVLGKERSSSGGAVYYSSLPLQRMGLKTAIITKLAKKDFNLLKELKKEGIEVFAHQSKETTGMKNTYFTKDLDRRVCEPTSIAEPFTIKEVQGIEAKIYHIGALIAGEVPIEVVEELSRKGRISLDAQGFVRVAKNKKLTFEDWKEKKEFLGLVEFLKTDSAEAEILTNQTNLEEAAKQLATYGSKEIMITHADGVLVYADKKFYKEKFAPKKVLGRTGRGDTCIAAYIGKRLTVNPEEACKFAAALTSLKLEKQGPFKQKIKAVNKRLTN